MTQSGHAGAQDIGHQPQDLAQAAFRKQYLRDGGIFGLRRAEPLHR